VDGDDAPPAVDEVPSPPPDCDQSMVPVKCSVTVASPTSALYAPDPSAPANRPVAPERDHDSAGATSACDHSTKPSIEKVSPLAATTFRVRDLVSPYGST
jgi:hypothetical protein